MEANINDILANVILGVVGTAVTAAIAAGTTWLAKHVSAKNLALMQVIAQEAVQATQQLYKASGGKIDNATLRANAIAQAQRLAGKVGLKFTDAQVGTLIESAVLEMKQFIAPSTPPAIRDVDGRLLPPEEPLTPALERELDKG